MEMPMSDVNDLDEVVCELEIEDSDMSPAEAVREIKAEIVTLRADKETMVGMMKRDAAAVIAFRADQERIRDEAFQLGRQASWDEAKETIEALKAELAETREALAPLDAVVHELGIEDSDSVEAVRALRAELATANDRIEHMSTVLVDAEELLGVEEAGELILRPIERLKAELAEAYKVIADQSDDLLEYSGGGRQDAEIARLKEALKWYATAVVSSIHPDSPGHCDDGRCARAALACRPQGEKS